MVLGRRSSIVAAFVLAPVLLLVGGIAFYDDQQGGPAGVAPAPQVIQVGEAAAADDVAASVTALQERLRRLPEDWSSWTSLGFAYIAQARTTADPTYYPRAEKAFAVVLEAEPDDANALTGQAALANARHEFATGRDLASRAVELNPYSSTAKGVLSDALFELGEYDTALDTLQEMVDLEPSVASFTRVAFSYELRGDLEGARYGLDRALEMAPSPADTSFVLFYLGEFAFGSGDHEGAAAHYAEGLRLDPENVLLLAGQAKVKAALGDVDGALADYAEVVQRLPQPSYLVEYGELLESVGRVEDAQAQYDVADAASLLAADAGVETDIEVALYHADHGQPDLALAIAEAQYETRRSVQVEDAMAWALHASGRDDEALEHALLAQQLGTRSALWDYHRGMIQLELGMVAEARASLTLALETNPAFSPRHVPLARAALATLGPA